MTVESHKDDVGVTLYCPDLNIYTCGKTEQEARRKFIDALVEYWQFLQDHDFKDESPYQEHLKLLAERVLPALANASLLSPHRPPALVNKLLDILGRERRRPAWDADIFGNLVRSSAR